MLTMSSNFLGTVSFARAARRVNTIDGGSSDTPDVIRRGAKSAVSRKISRDGGQTGLRMRRELTDLSGIRNMENAYFSPRVDRNACKISGSINRKSGNR